ncbi:MAG: cytochrome c oxidase assembly protein [Alphaproteobacteria bacterium]|jgi:cytochrome c oxidase assembly protein subunit 11|nr:cytochrome c oxidase assembly protein [Alphaproteobacteria bacterium]
MRAGRKNIRTLAFLGAFVAGMGGLAYASVPLYEIFCRVTGYGGTTQVAAAESNQVVERTLKIRFDSNVNPALGWAFDPVLRSMDLKVGENALAFYQAENETDDVIVGTATFNVTPDKAGLYFNKVECFCFTEQVLKPGQRVDMPVSFFIDPSIVEDPNLDDVTTITLSYTFFRAEDQSAAERIEQAGLRAGGDGRANTVDQRTN